MPIKDPDIDRARDRARSALAMAHKLPAGPEAVALVRELTYLADALYGFREVHDLGKPQLTPVGDARTSGDNALDIVHDNLLAGSHVLRNLSPLGAVRLAGDYIALELPGGRYRLLLMREDPAASAEPPATPCAAAALFEHARGLIIDMRRLWANQVGANLSDWTAEFPGLAALIRTLLGETEGAEDLGEGADDED